MTSASYSREFQIRAPAADRLFRFLTLPRVARISAFDSTADSSQLQSCNALKSRGKAGSCLDTPGCRGYEESRRESVLPGV